MSITSRFVGLLLVVGAAWIAVPAEASVRVIPKPASVDQRGDARFHLSPDTEIVVGRSSADARSVANYLADLLRRGVRVARLPRCRAY